MFDLVEPGAEFVLGLEFRDFLHGSLYWLALQAACIGLPQAENDFGPLNGTVPFAHKIWHYSAAFDGISDDQAQAFDRGR
jgi:hypothetical protein